MKIKGFIITGIIFAVIGIGLTAVASTQIDYHEELGGIFCDPTLEEKKQTFGEIVKITYEGADESIDIVYEEGENNFTYYEGKKLSYDIEYDEELQELFIKQNHSYTFFNFCLGSKKSILSIHSPLEEIEIDASAGNIMLRDLTISNAKIDVNAGNLRIENSNLSALDIQSDAGNVNINTLFSDIVKIEVRAGNIRIENSSLLDTTILANAGNVKIIDSTFTKLYAKLNAGNLGFTGDILSYGELKLNAGNMNMTMARSKDAYTINGEGMGDTTILYNVSAGNAKVAFSE